MGAVLGTDGRFRTRKWLISLSVVLGLYALPVHALELQEPLPWFDRGKPTAQAMQALTLLETASFDGLAPEDYNVIHLRDAFNATLNNPTLPSANTDKLYAALTASMLNYLRDLHKGRLDPKVLRQRFKAPIAEYFDAQAHLSYALANNTLPEVARQVAPDNPLYARLRDALVHYRELPDAAAWDINLPALPGKKLTPGDTYEGIDMLMRRLVSLGDVSTDAMVPELYEGDLVQGVQAFQERHGLLVDGILGSATLKELEVKPAQRINQIELTLERLRWTPLFDAPRMIVVNIPEFMLRAYEVHDGKIHVKTQMKIIVGRALKTQTPVFDEDMLFIEFSPYWNVPRSIVRSETIPRLSRDPAYFNRQGFEFVSKDGDTITHLSEDNIEALANGELRIRQRPGPHNALGDIKFIFPNNQNIYLHHTPTPDLFGRDRRDFSHGCVRVEEPVDLARFVLYDDPEWTEERIRQAMSSGTSRTIKLREPVRVLITYSTVMPKNDKVYFFPDIYGQDALLDKALRQRPRVIPLL